MNVSPRTAGYWAGAAGLEWHDIVNNGPDDLVDVIVGIDQRKEFEEGLKEAREEILKEKIDELTERLKDQELQKETNRPAGIAAQSERAVQKVADFGTRYGKMKKYTKPAFLWPDRVTVGVRGGVVQAVSCPPGVLVEVCDYDNAEGLEEEDVDEDGHVSDDGYEYGVDGDGDVYQIAVHGKAATWDEKVDVATKYLREDQEAHTETGHAWKLDAGKLQSALDRANIRPQPKD